jgi:thiol-disulfide isomerase/thioredoxin
MEYDAMKTIWKPLVLVLVAGIMVADLFLDYRERPAIEEITSDDTLALDLPVGLAVGELAPDFIGTTLKGETIRLSDLRGKTVLVNIFASWCGPCRIEAPHLAEVFNASGEDVVFVGLNLQESPEAVAGFREDFGIEFPLVLNQDGKLTEIYRPIGLPTSWFIDTNGVVQYVHAGPINGELLAQAIEDVQAGLQPNPFSSTG